MIKQRTKVSLVILVSTCVISVISCYIQGLHLYHQGQQLVDRQTEMNQNRLENLLDSFNQDLMSINTLIGPCNKQRQGQLQKLALNNRDVSITYYVTKQGQTCSNFSELAPQSNAVHQRAILTGPISIDGLKPAPFQLSKKTKQGTVGIFFTPSILNQTLVHSHHPSITFLLYDATNQKFISDQGNHTTPLSLTHLNASSHRPIKYTDGQWHQINIVKVPFLKDYLLIGGLSTTWIMQTLLHDLWLYVLVAFIVSLCIGYFYHRQTNRKWSLIRQIKRALTQKEFIPFYQPVIDLSKNEIIGVECLARWQQPDGTILTPDHFLPTIQQENLMLPMTLSMLEYIFSDFGDYLQKNPDFHLAINLSPVHFYDDKTFKEVVTYCQYYQIHPNQLIFELTEQELLEEDNDFALTLMHQMRDKGFELALDDFGTGYSSIQYLQKFPFSYLKMDRQFTQAIGSTAITAQLVDSIFNIAKNLSLKLIAEGIETDEQENYLRANQVTLVQGFKYSKPVSFNTLMQKLNQS